VPSLRPHGPKRRLWAGSSCTPHCFEEGTARCEDASASNHEGGPGGHASEGKLPRREFLPLAIVDLRAVAA